MFNFQVCLSESLKEHSSNVHLLLVALRYLHAVLTASSSGFAQKPSMPPSNDTFANKNHDQMRQSMGFFLGLSELSHFSGAFSWLIPLIAHVCYANVPVRLDPLASLPLIEGLDSTWCSNIHRPRRLDQKQQKQQKQRLFFMGISWI